METLVFVVIMVAVLLIVMLGIIIYSMYQEHWKGRHEKAKWNKKLEAWKEEDRRKDLGYDDD
jgi:cbb3-type cytochrome oxidase subunit 3